MQLCDLPLQVGHLGFPTEKRLEDLCYCQLVVSMLMLLTPKVLEDISVVHFKSVNHQNI